MDRCKLHRRTFAVTLLTALVLPALAYGDVLVNAIERTVVACGRSVEPGIWYQSFSGGPRWAHITIKNGRGRIVWRRNATATSTWRYWHFRGACGARYVLTYKTVGGDSKFPFRVRAG